MAHSHDGKGIRETVQAQDLCVIREEFAYFPALADVMFGVQAVATQPIVIAGTADQRKKYLPALARGETNGAFALTERQEGSDTSAIALRAKKSAVVLFDRKQAVHLKPRHCHVYIVSPRCRDPKQNESALLS